MNQIARHTTPSFTFKPSTVAVGEIDEIYLVIKQNGVEVIRKPLADAVVGNDNFTWTFSQEETALLNSRPSAVVQIDYTSGTARYTTVPRQYDITESAINEVI